MFFKLSDRTIGLICASIAAFCWALLAIGLKYALNFTSSENIAAARMVFAFICLALFFISFKQSEIKKLKKDFPWKAFLAGSFLAFNYFGYMKGIELTGASNSQIMIQMGPMLLILIGVVLLKEAFSKEQTLSLLVAALGFGLFYYDQTELAQALSLSGGNLWLLMAAITWAIYATLQKQLTDQWSPQTLNLVVYGACSVGLLLNSHPSEMLNLNGHQWFILSLLGLNTFVSYGFLAEAFKRARASRVSLIITLNPLGTLALIHLGNQAQISWMPHESISRLGLLGALLVVTGVSWTLIRKKT